MVILKKIKMLIKKNIKLGIVNFIILLIFLIFGSIALAQEIENKKNTSVEINDRPSAFRYPRGNGVGINLPSISETLEIGKGRVIQEGKKVALLNFGTRLEQCKEAYENLLKKGITCTIVDARFAKPLDEKLIMEVASNHEVLISIEEGSIGGFGSHVMQFLSDRGVFDKGLKFRSMILPDIFIDQDTPEKMYEIAGLDSKKYAGHSLRSCFATSTAESGVEERHIMAMTGHKSTEMVRRYIKEANLFKNNALNKIKI